MQEAMIGAYSEVDYSNVILGLREAFLTVVIGAELFVNVNVNNVKIIAASPPPPAT